MFLQVGESLQEVEEQLGRAGADYREVWQGGRAADRDGFVFQVRRWRQCVSRVEPLASLIFGLELRLEVNTPGLGRYQSSSLILILQTIEEKSYILSQFLYFEII